MKHQEPIDATSIRCSLAPGGVPKVPITSPSRSSLVLGAYEQGSPLRSH